MDNQKQLNNDKLIDLIKENKELDEIISQLEQEKNRLEYELKKKAYLIKEAKEDN